MHVWLAKYRYSIALCKKPIEVSELLWHDVEYQTIPLVGQDHLRKSNVVYCMLLMMSSLHVCRSCLLYNSCMLIAADVLNPLPVSYPKVDFQTSKIN